MIHVSFYCVPMLGSRSRICWYRVRLPWQIIRAPSHIPESGDEYFMNLNVCGSSSCSASIMNLISRQEIRKRLRATQVNFHWIIFSFKSFLLWKSEKNWVEKSKEKIQIGSTKSFSLVRKFFLWFSRCLNINKGKNWFDFRHLQNGQFHNQLIINGLIP